MQILNHNKILQKVRRLAIEIAERNLGEKRIVLLGINNNGLGFAKILLEELKSLNLPLELEINNLRLNPAAPLSDPIEIIHPLGEVKSSIFIIVDDVANTGRTIFYAMRPLMDDLPKKIEVAVLVNREHKRFPVQVDYVGLSLATTLMENIEVSLKDKDYRAFLN